jgi:hypothetical protein
LIVTQISRFTGEIVPIAQVVTGDVAEYAATGSLALPIGTHFASNAWLTLVVGKAGSPYPKLFAVERTVTGAIDTLLILLPGALLIALVLWWARLTGRTGLSVNDAYRRIVERS